MDAASGPGDIPSHPGSGGSTGLEWTSVPRWPVPELPAAASYLACWFGDAARPRAGELLSGADPRVPVRWAGFGARWDTATEAELGRLLGDCHTGVRIILAGPESVVLRAASAARRLGADSGELVLLATETAGTAETTGTAGTAGMAAGGYLAGPVGRQVFCAACRRSFGAVAALGSVVTCPGCAADLIVDKRFSRPRAAYFGWPAGLDLHR